MAHLACIEQQRGVHSYENDDAVAAFWCAMAHIQFFCQFYFSKYDSSISTDISIAIANM